MKPIAKRQGRGSDKRSAQKPLKAKRHYNLRSHVLRDDVIDAYWNKVALSPEAYAEMWRDRRNTQTNCVIPFAGNGKGGAH